MNVPVSSIDEVGAPATAGGRAEDSRRRSVAGLDRQVEPNTDDGERLNAELSQITSRLLQQLARGGELLPDG